MSWFLFYRFISVFIGDPEMGGLSSGEKAALSRGQEPKGVRESDEKREAADRFFSENQGGKQSSTGQEEEEEFVEDEDDE